MYSRAPGMVARCPGCDSVLFRLVRGPGRAWLDLRGLSHLEFTLPGSREWPDVTAEADTRGPQQEPDAGGGADPVRLVIRDRTPEDIPTCISTLAAVHARDAFPLVWPPDPAAWLTPRNLRRVWVAQTATGRLAGHVVVRADPDRPGERAEVSRLFVHPDLRRHGVAQRLVETCRAWALEHGRALMLEVTAVGERTGAMRFYEAMGWRYVETRQASWTSAAGEPVQLHEYRLDP